MASACPGAIARSRPAVLSAGVRETRRGSSRHQEFPSLHGVLPAQTFMAFSAATLSLVSSMFCSTK